MAASRFGFGTHTYNSCRRSNDDDNGVALWFFPRPDKDDKLYKPDLILATYFIITISTALRFIFQIISSFVQVDEIIKFVLVFSSVAQVIGIIIFFVSIWEEYDRSEVTLEKQRVSDFNNNYGNLMSSRRDFIKKGGLALAGIAIAKDLAASEVPGL